MCNGAGCDAPREMETCCGCRSTHVGVVLALGVVVLNFLLVSSSQLSAPAAHKRCGGHNFCGPR
jgi:hypothetical protein